MLLAAWPSPAAAAAIADLCAPCTDGAQCQSGICAIGAPGTTGRQGLCTQACGGTDAPCPVGFTCASTPQNVSLCTPAQSDACPAAADYRAPLNVQCANPGTTDNPNSAIAGRTCAAGLSCFFFPSSVGYCLTGCNEIDPQAICPVGQQCCFNVDAQSHCVGSAPTSPNGGCFTVRHAGESCGNIYQALCDLSTQCYFLSNQTLAKCYHFCDADPKACGSGETCVSGVFPDGQGGTTAVCCDRLKYIADNPATCVPVAAPCGRQIAVQCDTNDQCLSGLCLKNRGSAACSAPCQSDADCPAVGVDLNGDGRGDGGARCIDVGGAGRCWPIAAAASPPACAASAVPAPAGAAPSKGGCAATASPIASACAATLLAACAGRLRRRRRP